MSRHLVAVHFTDGPTVAALSEDATPTAAVKEAPASVRGKKVRGFDSTPINENLMAVLEEHPGILFGHEQSTTDVLVVCEGFECSWSTTITGRLDQRGHGQWLFLAHQAAMIQEAFTLSAHSEGDREQ